MVERIIILSVGFGLDCLLGDPEGMWHPVRGIGTCISQTEKGLQHIFKMSDKREEHKTKKRIAGMLLVLFVLVLSVGIPVLLLHGLGRIHPWLKLVVECILCYQLLALKSLKQESSKVYACLKKKELEEARKALSMIVGRDTKKLEETGIIKATIETVAENTSDGVIAPLLFLILFGIPGMLFYKAVNTMDSMVGYQNDAYCYFGTAAAKLDDYLNFIPARIAALVMILASFLLKMNGKNAIYIYQRDRYQHASPNSAQTESVCAGALNVQLGGSASYFGKLKQKPTIGDVGKEVEAEDIQKANKLLDITSILTLFMGILLLGGIG